ncbi:MAG: bifunctional phosphoribosylaminoimidazolecarboxamide formyltransferase/IMP cyclohydrolase [Candidatus Cloacimonadales bacterium]
MIKIKRALISVSDKTGIVEFAQNLKKYNCEIISTGGTKQVLEAAGLAVTDISSVTGNPEAFGGRMKTISFQIESALLYDREKDAAEAAELGIEPIDLVVCNLYPFSKVKAAGADLAELIENIDIGGPTMLRASAKNYRYLATITDSADYRQIGEELAVNNGALQLATRFELMRKTFNHTADYESLIATTMDEQVGIKSIRKHFTEGKQLRYGENSHQKGYLYRDKAAKDSLCDMEILHGKELSFNNLNDIQSAVDAVKDLPKHAISVVKHNNPCGLACGAEQLEVFTSAWAGDPISAFGSIIAFNQTLELKAAKFLDLDNPQKSLRKFVEVVIAPDFAPQVLEYLQFHKNLRVLKYDPQKQTQTDDLKFLNGAILRQDCDNKLYDKLQVVTEASFDLEGSKDLLEFGITAMRQVKSNSIVIVRQLADGTFQLLGMGAGQPNRVISTKLAIEKARENLAREYEGDDLEAYQRQQLSEALLVSDAFFPFPDNVELAEAAGLKKIIQPGGSIKDKRVIKRCNELGVSMVFSGIRHFKH